MNKKRSNADLGFARDMYEKAKEKYHRLGKAALGSSDNAKHRAYEKAKEEYHQAGADLERISREVADNK